MKRRILIIEDDVELVDMLSMRLEKNGFEVLRALDGSSGLMKAKTEKPDLIILDLMMPVMDGLQLAQALRADASTQAIPILVLTGAVREDFLKKISGQIDAAEYITKPFDPQDLLAKIHKILSVL